MKRIPMEMDLAVLQRLVLQRQLLLKEFVCQKAQDKKAIQKLLLKNIAQTLSSA